MTPRWTPLRVVLAALGAAALIAGGAGTYLALQGNGGATEEKGSVLRMHDKPRAIAALSFVDGKGRARTLADFRGKTVLLNLWATWCPPCREEMPSLDRLQKALGGPAFEVVALSIDAEGAPIVERFYKELGIDALAIYVDPGLAAPSALKTPGLPTTLLIDAQGRELGRHAGPAEWDSAEVLRVVSRHARR